MGISETKDNRNIPERFLGLFTDIRGGEGTTVLLLALNVFLLLFLYYIIKPVRDAFILTAGGFKIGSVEFGGAELKSVTAAGQSILLLGVVPLYGMLAGRSARRRLINIVTLFFTGCLGIFYILAKSRVNVAVPFYLWVGIFNVMIVAQIWAFANDLYTKESGKRLFVIIAFGQSLGAYLGSLLTGYMVEPLGVYQLLLVAGALLCLSLLITNTVHSRERHKSEEVAAARAKEAEEPIGKGNPYKLVFGSKYLILVAFLILFLNWVNTTGEYILGRTVEHAAEKETASAPVQERQQKAYEEALAAGKTDESSRETFKKQWEGDYEKTYTTKFFTGHKGFYSMVNLLGLLIQLFLVSRILKYLGVRIALLILPVIALGGYALLVIYPVMGVIRWAKTAENSTDYSLQNTVRQVLFLPTTREQKYKAKQVIDTLFVRIGDFLSAGLVVVGAGILAFQIKHFALINLLLVLVWIILAIFIGRENRKLTADSE